MLIAVRRNAVDLVIRRHDVGNMSVLYGRFEWLEPIFADGAFGIIRRTNIGAPFGLAMDCKMFRGGHDVGLVQRWAGSLIASDRSDPYARHQVGIFAVRFFGTAPARVACEVEHRREAL